jgi:hypothetical protein
MNSDNFSLENRLLCSDDNCIGTIGPDGHCKECGTLYAGDEPVPPSADNTDPAGDVEEDEHTGNDGVEVSADDSSEKSVSSSNDEAGDPDERTCCTDDTCIGIIGTDGKCGTCGKPD